MKYCYRIGYGSHEESDEFSLWHEEQYTEEQLNEIVSKAYVMSYLDKSGMAYHMEEFNNVGEHKSECPMRTSLQRCFSLMIKYLLSDFGFEETQYQSESWVNGWAHLGDENDDDESETTKQMLRALVAVERKWE